MMEAHRITSSQNGYSKTRDVPPIFLRCKWRRWYRVQRKKAFKTAKRAHSTVDEVAGDTSWSGSLVVLYFMAGLLRTLTDFAFRRKVKKINCSTFLTFNLLLGSQAPADCKNFARNV